MKWFYLASFVAGLIICAMLTSLIVYGFAAHDPRESKVVLKILPGLVLFGWASREMYQSFKEQGAND